MGKSQETYSKKEKEKKRLKKRQEKALKREERKENSPGGGLDNMMAYLDANGNIVDSPPEITKKVEIDAEDIVLGVPSREYEEEVAPEGKVAFYNDSKGYGFIKDLRSQESYFFHVNGLIDEVRENDKVTFELERGPKGMNAVKVKILKDVPKPVEKPVEDEAETPVAEDATETPAAEDATEKPEDATPKETEE